MKKIIPALAILFFILPSVSSAAALTTQQSTSLIAVVQSSPGTPASAFVSLITAFSNITTAQASSLITVVQSAPGVPANAFVNLLTSFTVDTPVAQPTTPTNAVPTVTPQPTNTTSNAPTPPVAATSAPVSTPAPTPTPAPEPVVTLPQTEVKFETGLRPLGGGSAYDAYVFYNRTNKYIGYNSVTVKVWKNPAYQYLATTSPIVLVKMENHVWSLIGSATIAPDAVSGSSEDTAITVTIPLSNPSGYYCNSCGFYVVPTARSERPDVATEFHLEATEAQAQGGRAYMIKFVSFSGETFGTKPTYPGSGGTIYTFD